MSLALLLALTLLAAGPRSPRACAAPEPMQAAIAKSHPVLVRVYNAVRIPASERRQAQQTASNILIAVGIDVKWKVCGAALIDNHDECSEPLDAGELIVRLTSGSALSPAVLGFASAPGVVATALVDRIQETARRTKRPVATLLGAVMAHELVHVLLGPQSHAARGVMRAEWTDQDIQLGRIWKISLTADQRRAIATSLLARLDAAHHNAVTAEVPTPVNPPRNGSP